MSEFTIQMVVARDHPSLPGHFPGQPIVPGVVLLDLIAAAIRESQVPRLCVVGIAAAKFHRAVLPDDVITVTAHLEPAEQLRARFAARVDDAPAVEGAIHLAVASD